MADHPHFHKSPTILFNRAKEPQHDCTWGHFSHVILQSVGYKRNLRGVAVGPQVDAKDKGIILNNEHMLCFLILD